MPINWAPATRITKRITTRIINRTTRRNPFQYKVELMLLLFSSRICQTSAGHEWPTRTNVLCSTDCLAEHSCVFGDFCDMLHRVLCSTNCCGTTDCCGTARRSRQAERRRSILHDEPRKKKGAAAGSAAPLRTRLDSVVEAVGYRRPFHDTPAVDRSRRVAIADSSGGPCYALKGEWDTRFHQRSGQGLLLH